MKYIKPEYEFSSVFDELHVEHNVVNDTSSCYSSSYPVNIFKKYEKKLMNSTDPFIFQIKQDFIFQNINLY